MRDEWQPIETAPKDGKWIQLWRGRCEYFEWDPLVIGRWSNMHNCFVWPTDRCDPWFDQDRMESDVDCGDVYESDQFTHWMPLPTPPVQP